MTQARSISIAVVLIVVVFGAGFAGGYFWPKRTSPTVTPPDGPDRPDPPTRRPHRGRMLRHMVDRLGLDEKQITSVQSILRTYKPQLRALHAKIRPEVDAIRAKMQGEIRKVLTDKQRSEFDRMVQEFNRRKRRRLHRFHRGPGPLGPRPPQMERRGPRFDDRRPGPAPTPAPPEPKSPPAPK